MSFASWMRIAFGLRSADAEPAHNNANAAVTTATPVRLTL
jgi:hypothetical protein